MVKPILERRPEEIFKARVERKLVRKAIPETTRRKLIDILRIRKGLLSEEELKYVKQKILNDTQKVLLHFTDSNFFDSILRNGLKSNNAIMRIKPDFHHFGFTEQLTKARERYEFFLKPHNLIKLGETATPKQVLERIFKLLNGESIETEFYDSFITFFSQIADKFNILINYNEHIANLRNLLHTKSINEDDYAYSVLQLQKAKDIYKLFSINELKIVNRYKRAFKLGNIDFLNDSNAVNQLVEIFARAYAREGFYTINTAGDILSAMNMAIIYPKLFTDSVSEYDQVVNLRNKIRKPIGFFIDNQNNLKFILETMFSNAKSIDDVVPVYGNQGKLLWPV